MSPEIALITPESPPPTSSPIACLCRLCLLAAAIAIAAMFSTTRRQGRDKMVMMIGRDWGAGVGDTAGTEEKMQKMGRKKCRRHTEERKKGPKKVKK